MGRNATSSKWAQNSCLRIPSGQASILVKALVPKRPNFKTFWVLAWAKMRHHGLNMGQKHLFEHLKWSRITFGTMRF